MRAAFQGRLTRVTKADPVIGEVRGAMSALRNGVGR